MAGSLSSSSSMIALELGLGAAGGSRWNDDTKSLDGLVCWVVGLVTAGDD